MVWTCDQDASQKTSYSKGSYLSVPAHPQNAHFVKLGTLWCLTSAPLGLLWDFLVTGAIQLLNQCLHQRNKCYFQVLTYSQEVSTTSSLVCLI